jgi:hypothetical protein
MLSGDIRQGWDAAGADDDAAGLEPLSRCAVGQAKYFLICAADGGILNDPVMTRMDENRFWFALASSDRSSTPMAVDSLDPCGMYFGTTGGQVYGSADGGDSWAPIVRDLPPVLSVEVQTLP